MRLQVCSKGLHPTLSGGPHFSLGFSYHLYATPRWKAPLHPGDHKEVLLTVLNSSSFFISVTHRYLNLLQNIYFLYFSFNLNTIVMWSTFSRNKKERDLFELNRSLNLNFRCNFNLLFRGNLSTYARNPKMFCKIAAKAVFWMLDLATSMFCVWLLKLDMVNRSLFCVEPNRLLLLMRSVA